MRWELVDKLARRFHWQPRDLERRMCVQRVDHAKREPVDRVDDIVGQGRPLVRRFEEDADRSWSDVPFSRTNVRREPIEDVFGVTPASLEIETQLFECPKIDRWLVVRRWVVVGHERNHPTGLWTADMVPFNRRLQFVYFVSLLMPSPHLVHSQRSSESEAITPEHPLRWCGALAGPAVGIAVLLHAEFRGHISIDGSVPVYSYVAGDRQRTFYYLLDLRAADPS